MLWARLSEGVHLAATAHFPHWKRRNGSVKDNVVVEAFEQTQDSDATAKDKDIRESISKMTAALAKNAEKVPTMTIEDIQYGNLTFKGDGKSMLQQFNYKGDMKPSWNGGVTVQFTGIPPDATIVVNLLGTGLLDLRLNSPIEYRNRLLWSVPDAESVKIGGYYWSGSILVGNKDSETHVSAPVDGRVYVAGDLYHSAMGGEFHNYPFEGELPIDFQSEEVNEYAMVWGMCKGDKCPIDYAGPQPHQSPVGRDETRANHSRLLGRKLQFRMGR